MARETKPADPVTPSHAARGAADGGTRGQTRSCGSGHAFPSRTDSFHGQFRERNQGSGYGTLTVGRVGLVSRVKSDGTGRSGGSTHPAVQLFLNAVPRCRDQGTSGRKISQRGIPMRRSPFSIVIAVAGFAVMWFWGPTIVGWMTR
jgi:hypothetical protein